MLKVIVGIATTGDRPEQLSKTVESLKNQAEVKVYNNSWNDDLTDFGKFYFTEPNCYYFSCDDDIIYPPDYIETTIKWIEELKCIVSWHGRKLYPNATKYYGYPHTEEIRYFQETTEVKELNVPGTGVTAFRTDYFNPEIWNSKYKRCSDLVFGLEACKQNKKILSPPKKHLWIAGQDVKSSIFKTESTGTQEVQIKLMKELIKCKNG